MPLLVDGDNLLGTWRDRTRSDDNKSQLSFTLARYAKNRRQRLIVFFDGTRASGVGYAGEVRFSGRGRSADDAILELLRGEREPQGWTVITSDRPLADRCRHLGARIERSDQFRKRLVADADASGDEKPSSESDVDYWLEQFGGDDE